MEELLKEELEILLKAGLEELSEEELRELRRRIILAMPKKHQFALLSGNREEGLPQEEYDKFVYSVLQLYKQEKVQERQTQAHRSTG